MREEKGFSPVSTCTSVCSPLSFAIHHNLNVWKVNMFVLRTGLAVRPHHVDG